MHGDRVGHIGRIDRSGARRQPRARVRSQCSPQRLPRRIARRLPGEASPSPSSRRRRRGCVCESGAIRDSGETQMVAAEAGGEGDPHCIAIAIAIRDSPGPETQSPGGPGGRREPIAHRDPRAERVSRSKSRSRADCLSISHAEKASPSRRGGCKPEREPERHAEKGRSESISEPLQASWKEARGEPQPIAVRDSGA